MLRKSLFKSRGRIVKMFSKINERGGGGVQITHQKINRRRRGEGMKIKFEGSIFSKIDKYSPVYVAVMSIPINID